MNLKMDQILSYPLGIIFLASLSLSAQAECNSVIPFKTPTADFVSHNNGTVTHTPTGLMWKVCSESQTWSVGSCIGTASGHTWAEALQLPSTLNAGGGFSSFSDWRLPNFKELVSITETACRSPSINATIFPSSPSLFYWSSTPHQLIDFHARVVNFSTGTGASIPRSSGPLRVRLVRGGE